MPVLYLLLAYPCYFVAMCILYRVAGIDTMVDVDIQVLDTIGVMEIAVSFVLALAVGALVIKVLLNNKYQETKKAVLNAQAEAAAAGAQVDEFKLAQIESFDKAYTKAMILFAVLDAFFVAGGIVAASFFYGQFGVLAVDIVTSIFAGAILGVVFEKGARAVGDGVLTERYTDHSLAIIAQFRADAPADGEDASKEVDITSVIAQATASAIEATLAKFGKA